jgi:HAD superfamily hydrolase (TIGR01458 family)
MENKIRACLIDLDGTFYVDNECIPGAVNALQQLRDQKILLRFVTNTTNKSRISIQKKLQTFGVEILPLEIYSPSIAAAQFLRQRPETRCWVLTRGDAKEDFHGINLTDHNPNVIVVGDLMEDFTFELLNRVFRKLLEGAELIALQKNRYWETSGELTMDAGPFIAALEYASGREARVVGKPSAEYFSLALEGLGLKPEEVVMVGDDVEMDIGGAQKAGLKTVLVQTGKFRKELFQRSLITPDALLNSIAELSEWIDR